MPETQLQAMGWDEPCQTCEELEDWTPTADNINRLPEPLRKYIHDVETNCDPAHLVQENERLRQELRDAKAALAMVRS
ncbi:MAG: hypothetical protein F4Y02_10650 [Chloroflexi bacterium]|nr:hypothetical protein [Chloroflexota bacterium]